LLELAVAITTASSQEHGNGQRNQKSFDRSHAALLIWRQPGDLGVLRGVFDGFSEEARTRGFASLTLVSFAFLDYSVSGALEKPSILGCT
jgi:hypothetical protein